ncbi:MAG: molybdopterin-guanine dinucleotide biosynthesis protein B [Pseudomonadota bacterium]
MLGFAGYSGSGKTTLLEKLIPLLVAHGLRISVIKHAHHHFEVDKPGKDSYRHRKAGASEVLVASSQRWALMHELGDAAEPGLDKLYATLAPCDLVLVEGFKYAAIPKLEIHRGVTGHPHLYPQDSHIIALVSDNDAPTPLPVLDIDAPQEVAGFILKYFEFN